MTARKVLAAWPVCAFAPVGGRAHVRRTRAYTHSLSCWCRGWPVRPPIQSVLCSSQLCSRGRSYLHQSAHGQLPPLRRLVSNGGPSRVRIVGLCRPAQGYTAHYCCCRGQSCYRPLTSLLPRPTPGRQSRRPLAPIPLTERQTLGLRAPTAAHTALCRFSSTSQAEARLFRRTLPGPLLFRYGSRRSVTTYSQHAISFLSRYEVPGWRF